MAETCPVCWRRKCEGPPICGLYYIANSPTKENGGFHPEAVKTAKGAIRLIRKLQKRAAK